MAASHFDLKITSRTLVKASEPPPGFPPVLEASNLDLVLGSFPIVFIAVYPTPSAAFPAVVAAIRASLPAFLSHFFPFAGRVVCDPATNIPEIACSNAGAELVLADAAIPLAAVDFADVDRSIGSIQIPFDPSLPLSLQAVRFACGGFSLSWATNHLLADGRGVGMLITAWAELLRTGGLSWEPYHDRSLLRPRFPPRYRPSLDAEFTRYAPGSMINSLMAATMVRRMYRIEAADVERLRLAASGGTRGRPASRFTAICAHVWKLLAAAVGDTDPSCRMAWIVDGRKSVGDAVMDRYVGNMVTYSSREASVAEVSRMPLAGIAAMVRSAIAAVSNEERFQEMVDWMEVNKGAFREGGKWTETVGVGLGSPALVMSALHPFRIEGDFGFGKPHMLVPWMRPGRMGSSWMMAVPSARGDGSWVLNTRMWPRLAEVVEADPEGVLKPATAAAFGFTVPVAAPTSCL